MSKKHHVEIPPHLLRRALDLLDFHVPTDDPQRAFIDLLDNYREPEELQAKTGLAPDDCKFVTNLRDIATALRCKVKN